MQEDRHEGERRKKEEREKKEKGKGKKEKNLEIRLLNLGGGPPPLFHCICLKTRSVITSSVT